MRIFCQLPRRAGMLKRNMHARTAPPAAYKGVRWTAAALLVIHEGEEGAVVAMAREAFPALAPVMLTGVVAPNVRVGGTTALGGLEASAAVRATLPVNPSTGVTVMVETFPLVAP